MKIKPSVPIVFNLEMSLPELVGLYKMVGATAQHQRITDFHLSKEQSEALDSWYSQLYDYFQILEITSHD